MAESNVLIQGSVASFIPGLSPVEPASKAPDVIVPTVDNAEQATQALNALSHEERTTMLKTFFANDLEIAKKQASTEAYQAAFDNSKHEHEEALNAKLSALDEHIDAFSSVVDNMNSPEKWQISDESVIKELIVKSVSTITSNLIESPEINLARFTALANEHIADKPKTLYIPQGLHTILVRTKKLDAIEEMVTVKADVTLEKGDYRIEFEKSGIEYSLKQSLQNFASMVADANISEEGQ